MIGPAKGIDFLNHCCPFAVARLGQFCLATAVRCCDHYAYADDAYYIPSLVEVVDIVIYNAVFGLEIPHKGKSFANDLWIFALGPLVVVFTHIMRPELWLAFDEVVCLELANRRRVAYV